MMTYQSDDVLNPGLLSGFKALDSHPGKLVGVVEQEPRLPVADTDDSAHQRNSGQRRRLRNQFDASAVIGHTPMFSLSAFSGGAELDWDWD
jgi:hypothetical protein